jgi:hypothetical protein
VNPEETLDRLDQLLDEERAALRRLDGQQVAAIADEKSSLIHGLQRVGLADRHDLVPRIRALAAGLRHNAVLLAHARDCLRDVQSAFRAPAPSFPSPSPAPGAPARLSLRG